MSYMFSPEGVRALREAARPENRLLLALDFDGTLAPIVARPELAQTPLGIARVLREIGGLVDVAVVSGRSVEDVAGRLGFHPRFVVGNHGLEGVPDSTGTEARQIVAQWRAVLDDGVRRELALAGVQLEDKGHSLSFHYRVARDRGVALAVIDRAIGRLVPPARLLAGKCVVNVLPENTSDKFQAILELVRHISGDSVIFAGDDVTDDVVFESAPANWLTIRVDAQGRSRRARFHLAQTEMVLFLQRLLAEIRLQAMV